MPTFKVIPTDQSKVLSPKVHLSSRIFRTASDFHSYFCDAGVPWFRQKMLQPFGEMLLCSTVTPWPLGLFGSVAPTCHSGFRPAINVDDGRHEMGYKTNTAGNRHDFFEQLQWPMLAGVKSTYLRQTMSHQHGHTYNLCPKQVDLGWCVIKANWLMHHQVSKSNVVYYTNTHLQVDPNNTLCWRNMCHCVGPFQLCGNASSACYPAVKWVSKLRNRMRTKTSLSQYARPKNTNTGNRKEKWILHMKLDETDFQERFPCGKILTFGWIFCKHGVKSKNRTCQNHSKSRLPALVGW